MLSRKQRLQRVDNFEATARLWHLLSTLQERCCHRHMQDLLPAGWLALAVRELNPLDRDERFLSLYISSPFPGFSPTLPDVISESLSLDAGSHTPAVHRVLSPVSSTMSSAFPKQRWIGCPRVPHELRLLVEGDSRGCKYSFMFRPPSLLAPQIVPTAANNAAGQPGLLHPGLSCFVTSTRTGYANRPNTGNCRYRDFHPVRLSALSAAHLAPTVVPEWRRH